MLSFVVSNLFEIINQFIVIFNFMGVFVYA